jgi:tetratricopeptide (TPR) repeat protein
LFLVAVRANRECYNSRMFYHSRAQATPSSISPAKFAFSLRLFALVILLAFPACLPVCHAQNAAVNSEPSVREAHAAAAAGRWDEAAAALARAIELYPRDPALRVEFGDARRKEDRFPEAIASYQEALRLSSHNLPAEMGLAAAYRGVRNLEEAQVVLEGAIREHPTSPAPLALLGNIEIELQTYDAAIGHLRAALARDPTNNETRNLLADAYKAKGDPTNALTQLNKVLARDPSNALAYFLRAEIYSDQNNDAKALPDAEKVLQLQPENPSGRAALGKILLRTPPGATPEQVKSRCVRAAKVLSPLLDTPHLRSETLFLLSRAYQCAGQTEDAKKTLIAFEAVSQQERSAREGEQRSLHLVLDAEDRALKNDPKGALDLAQQALERDPSNGAAYSLMAKIYFSAGDLLKAEDAIAKALKIGPNHPDFLYVQGKIFAREGKLDDALAAFRQTALVNPKESDAYYEMGLIYKQRDDTALAIAAFKKAVDLSPDDPDYRRALASVSKPQPSP